LLASASVIWHQLFWLAVEESSSINHQAISNAYYLEALGNKGLGKTPEAKRLFDAAVKEYNGNLWARIIMGN
jgi:hypothetical protein